MNKKFPLYLLIFCFFIGIVVSCKSVENEPTEASANIAVKSFKLSADTSVLANLDSVFFSIDLNKREIYNADSLPMGTNITKLVATIGFPLVKSAELFISGGERMKNDTTINYATNPTDTLDFSGKVQLELKSENQLASGKYTIKVNVHKMKPDSLYWNQMARRDLPSFTPPLAQKTIEYKNQMFCLIRESSQYVLSTTADPAAANAWTKQRVEFPFKPSLRSFTATDDALYILSTAGDLYTSTTGTTWTSCNTNFYSLIGGYQSTLLAISSKENIFYHDVYPRPAGYSPVACESEFPIKDSSPLITFTTQWGTAPQSMILGGSTARGQLTGATWGYDGKNWGLVSNLSIPARKGAVLIPYFTFKTNNRWIVTKYTTWIAIGGINAAGEATKDVYISMNQGITWSKGDELLQLPTYIAPFANAQAIIKEVPMSSRSTLSADVWEPIASRKLPVWCSIIPPMTSRSYVQTWDCPYIYMFGGESANGTLMNNVWRGVLNRLSFRPII